MKFSNTPLARISLRYGAIGGLLAAALVAALYYLGQHPMMVSPYLDFRILLCGVFIFFALKEIRDHYQQGVLFFWQGMVGSYIIIFIITGIGALGILALSAWDADFVSAYVASMTAYLRDFPEEDIKVIGREVYERNLSLLASTNGKTLAISYFGQGMLIGFFLSIVLSVILRKQPKNA